MAPVHPHACGEHNAAIAIDVEGRRFIPTPVGNTRPQEKSIPADIGSSPRLWGTRRSRMTQSGDLRFIPTPVGNTRTGQSIGQGAVHPHACGEHAIVQATTNILPVHPHACGEHKSCEVLSTDDAVHPHACGEHLDLRPIRKPSGSSPRLWGTRSSNGGQRTVYGSSPRLWGTLRKAALPARTRFIPTPVGNTAPDDRNLTPRRFIPTPVGNTAAVRRMEMHVRFIPTPVGNTVRSRSPCQVLRFIPTPVGNTLPRTCEMTSYSAVHPHACGEHCISDARP